MTAGVRHPLSGDALSIPDPGLPPGRVTAIPFPQAPFRSAPNVPFPRKAGSS